MCSRHLLFRSPSLPYSVRFHPSPLLPIMSRCPRTITKPTFKPSTMMKFRPSRPVRRVPICRSWSPTATPNPTTRPRTMLQLGIFVDGGFSFLQPIPNLYEIRFYRLIPTLELSMYFNLSSLVGLAYNTLVL